MSKKVSVIIPVYNAEKYLDRCINSVLENTYKDIEIILINDGSKDNSKIIIERYAKKYPNKVIAKNQENKGPGKTRNIGIQISSGEYLMFVDADDYIEKKYIENFIKALDGEDLDMVVSGYKRVDDEKVFQTHKLENKYQWSKFENMAVWGRLYKKEYIVKKNIYFSDYNIIEDVYFNLQCNTLSDKIKVIENVEYNWYENKNSITRTVSKKTFNFTNLELLEKYYDVLAEKEGINDKNEEILATYFFLLYIQLIQWFAPSKTLKEIAEEQGVLIDFLEDKFSNLDSLNLKIILKGEKLKMKLIMNIMYLGYKFKFGKYLVYFYGKLNNRK